MAVLRRSRRSSSRISIDEAFLDVTGSFDLFGDGPTIARSIKDEVRDEVGLTASVGVATTKLVAKVASDLRKPDGLVVVPAGEEAAFLAPLPISRLWGVGERTGASLADYGVRTIGDLAGLPEDVVVRRFGKHGASLPDASPGHRCRPGPRRGPGEVGRPRAHVRRRHPRPRGHRANAPRDVRRRRRPAALVWDVRAGTVTVKIRDSSFRTMTRQRTLADPTDMTETIYRVALDLALPEVRGIRVRLLGVTRVEPRRSRAARASSAVDDPKRRRAVEAADAVRRRYGEDAVTRARLLHAGLPAPFERDPRNPLDRRARGVPIDPGLAETDADESDRRAVTDVDDIPHDEP